jgi:hypothetical protein
MPHGLHLQFVLAVVALILAGKFEVIRRKLGVLVDRLVECAERENECYKVIQKSDLSKLKALKDHERDNLVKGVKKLIGAALLHFKTHIAAAARRLKIVFDTYDKPIQIIQQAYDVETVTIRNLVKEFMDKYAADVELLGLAEWLQELTLRNEEFDSLSKEYNEELSVKTPLRPKDTRQDTDEAYNNMIEAIDGLVQLEGITEYAAFISELNTLIGRTNTRLAQHLGVIHANKDEAEKKAKEEAEIKAKEEAEKKAKEEAEKKVNINIDGTKSNSTTIEIKKDNTNLDITNS